MPFPPSFSASSSHSALANQSLRSSTRMPLLSPLLLFPPHLVACLSSSSDGASSSDDALSTFCGILHIPGRLDLPVESLPLLGLVFKPLETRLCSLWFHKLVSSPDSSPRFPRPAGLKVHHQLLSDLSRPLNHIRLE